MIPQKHRQTTLLLFASQLMQRVSSNEDKSTGSWRYSQLRLEYFFIIKNSFINNGVKRFVYNKRITSMICKGFARCNGMAMPAFS
jgi:hypothetical protein